VRRFVAERFGAFSSMKDQFGGRIAALACSQRVIRAPVYGLRWPIRDGKRVAKRPLDSFSAHISGISAPASSRRVMAVSRKDLGP